MASTNNMPSAEIDLSAPDPDEAPHGLDWSKAVRGRDLAWWRTLQAQRTAKGGLDIATVHEEDGATVYELHKGEHVLGRFPSYKEASEARRRILAEAAVEGSVAG